MSIFKNWLELNLTRAARAGKLERAVEVDDALQELANTIDAGLNAIVVGESGVGKTTLVHELVARATQGRGSLRLRGRVVLQISLRRRLSGLAQRYEIYGEVQKLFDGIRNLRSPPVVFIRDVDLAYSFDLEDQLAGLACASEVILIGEGSEQTVSALLEQETALQHRFGIVRVQEPDWDRATRIVNGWALRQKGKEFSALAVEQAVALSHRFLTRSKLPRKAIDLLKHASADTNAKTPVTAAAVIKRLSAQYRIPRVLVDPDVPLDLTKLKHSLAKSVVGQQEAVAAVVDTIGVIKAGLTDQRRPLAAMLFTGPTGVGKTLIAQTIATRLFGRRDRLIRVNMADYKSEADALLLFGVPGDGNTALRRGQLTSRMAGHSLGVLLLDEFEKSHPAVHDRFLQLMDEGEFINGAEERVSCRSFIIIVTTNAGHAHGEVTAVGFRPGLNGPQSPVDELATHFRYELLNRFDRVVRFRSLTEDDAREIVIAELRQLQSRIGLRQQGLTLEVDRHAVDLLVRRGYDAHCGARYLRRTIEQEVTTAIARLLVFGRPPENARVRIVACGTTIGAMFAERRERAELPGRPLQRAGLSRPPKQRSRPVVVA